MEYAALLQMVMGAIGAAAASGDNAKAGALREKALNEYGMALPDLQTIKAQYQKDSELGGVKANADYTGAQNEALGGLRDQAFGSGLSAQDLASLETARQAAAGFDRGNRERNLQEQAARGQLNSGFDIAQQMSASQGAADRMNQGATQTAGQNAARRLQAMSLYGGYAKSIRDADLNQKNIAASAQDRINQFNTADDRGVRDYNETELPNTKFNNAGKLAAAERQAADDYSGYARNTQQTWADLGEGTGRMGDAYRDQEERKRRAGGGSGSNYMSLASLMGDK